MPLVMASLEHDPKNFLEKIMRQNKESESMGDSSSHPS